MRTALKQNEKIILLVGKHWIVLAGRIAAAILVGIFLFFVWMMGWDAAAWILGGLFIILLLYCLASYLSLRPDIWIVTNLRIIDEWGFLTHHAKESPIDKINNVSYQQSVLGRLLNYGNVEIQTAAEMGATVYECVVSPKLLKDSITEAQENNKLGRDPDVPAGETKECPFCAETIKAKAVVCRYCGKNLV